MENDEVFYFFAARTVDGDKYQRIRARGPFRVNDVVYDPNHSGVDTQRQMIDLIVDHGDGPCVRCR